MDILNLTAGTSFSKRLRRIAVALALCAVPLIPAHPSRAQGDSLEYAVKATYLYKFAPFVDWPAQSFESATSPFNLCVVGHDPFGDILDRATAGQRIGGRQIVLRRIRIARRDSGCHAIFVGGTDVAETLERLRGAPVLTFTEAAQNSDAKGMVHFVIHDNRVRFEIDDETASRSGLTISSKVLSLALSVRRRT